MQTAGTNAQNLGTSAQNATTGTDALGVAAQNATGGTDASGIGGGKGGAPGKYRQSGGKEVAEAVLRQAVTAWLKKELCK